GDVLGSFGVGCAEDLALAMAGSPWVTRLELVEADDLGAAAGNLPECGAAHRSEADDAYLRVQPWHRAHYAGRPELTGKPAAWWPVWNRPPPAARGGRNPPTGSRCWPAPAAGSRPRRDPRPGAGPRCAGRARPAPPPGRRRAGPPAPARASALPEWQPRAHTRAGPCRPPRPGPGNGR